MNAVDNNLYNTYFCSSCLNAIFGKERGQIFIAETSVHEFVLIDRIVNILIEPLENISDFSFGGRIRPRRGSGEITGSRALVNSRIVAVFDTVEFENSDDHLLELFAVHQAVVVRVVDSEREL